MNFVGYFLLPTHFMNKKYLHFRVFGLIGLDSVCAIELYAVLNGGFGLEALVQMCSSKRSLIYGCCLQGTVKDGDVRDS